ncbi:unnamed protein product [Macrosiphum euphorbiae]|uniref:PDZ domain-containing protein n=1 Tax=Macrosiphum euphorbiae TaxID=13131 RepID=A0AAV0VQ06_9HEMI|nr:unnamed protein product [Macrosiphum euphorbiae]
MSSNSTIGNPENAVMLTQSDSDRSNDRKQDANLNRERNYDELKQKCDKAMDELTMLRKQHEEIIRRFDETRRELEYYRDRNQGLINRIEQADQDSSSLCTKLDVEKQILNRSEQDIPEDDTASGVSLNDRSMPYDSTLEGYKTLKKGYEDLHTTHSAAVVKMDMMKDEINQLKKQCNELSKERDIAVRETEVCHQQRLTALGQLNITIMEHNYLQDAIQIVQQEHKEAVNNMKVAVADSVKSRTELKELNKTHDAAVKEYRRIMSERDIVNNELEKLSEDLSRAYNKNKLLENEIKSFRDEKKTLQLHIESLLREISSALHDRDKALKECNNYQERFGEITTKNEFQRECKSLLNYGFSIEKERKNRNDSREQDASLDLFNSCQKERIDNLDLANKEIERLRNLANKYHNELDESQEEAKIAKRRRDFAFSERDKIVLERESIRTLCNSLRKQRDDAVSKLALAIRDCDDIMKQKSDTVKELNYFKEKMEVELEKEVRLLQLQATGRYNQDSSINTNLQDWDTEILNIDLGVLGTNEDLGIDLLGGRDDPLYPNDTAIYIKSVNKGSVAERKLRVNDCILRVNSLDCTSISKQLVLDTMRSLSSATLVVRRRKPVSPSKSFFSTQLEVNNCDHGISLETGVYINKITPGSVAAKDGNLDVGDRVLSINSTTVDSIKHLREAMLLLYESHDILTITTMKSTYCAGNCGSGLNRGIYKKYTNSATQTDTSKNSIYQKLQYVQSRRVMVNVPEKPHRNPSPVNNSISEQDQKNAIAELDSVIDAFRPHPAPPTTTKYLSHHRKSKELDKISDTWPKARSGPVIEHGIGTILHSHKNKERSPLSVLLNNPPGCSLQNNSKPVTSSIDFSDRITSNPSVTNKSSGAAVDPMLTFRVDVLNPGQISMPGNKQQSVNDWASKYFKRPLQRGFRNGPLYGELRRISIEKSGEPLGIKIFCVDSSGVFVSSITNEHSVAYKVGIKVGDQLLELCGINMRCATYQLAEDILQHCGNSVTILVQYKPDKYHDLKVAKSSTSSPSETSTPCNSPTLS